jgi:phosphomannomutase
VPAVADPADLRGRAQAWSDDDPDPATRAEVIALLALSADEPLAERFGARLTFGTAGIRGPLGAGPGRMNRALVRRVASGLAAHLLAADGEAARLGGVVIGRDARHQSDDFEADVAGVLAAAGIPALVLPGPCPTPLLAFAVRHLDAAAGVMVTASHNPSGDNGLKVYGADGAQIVPPTDLEISAAVDAVGPTLEIPLAPAGDPLVRRLGDEVLDAYLDAAAALVEPGPRHLRLVHTAMHGVATAPLVRLFERVGIELPATVASQAAPDPDFPTVRFPNPEEPGALDLALSEARRLGADAVIAHDPDADRLAVAVREDTGWRALTGDELGALLADHLLRGGQGEDRLVVRSVVSSTLLDRIADAHGVRRATTLTGFKWIVRAAADHPGARFTFGYEEALGYAVTDLVRDKDGLTAALVFADLAGRLRSEGSTVADRLEELAREHGLHATRTWSVRVSGAGAGDRIAAAVAGGRRAPAARSRRGRHGVERPARTSWSCSWSGGDRVVVRPSGRSRGEVLPPGRPRRDRRGAEGWRGARTAGRPGYALRRRSGRRWPVPVSRVPRDTVHPRGKQGDQRTSGGHT